MPVTRRLLLSFGAAIALQLVVLGIGVKMIHEGSAFAGMALIVMTMLTTAYVTRTVLRLRRSLTEHERPPRP